MVHQHSNKRQKNQNIEKQQENGEQKGKEQRVNRRIDARKMGVIENPSFYFKKVEGVEEELSRVLNYSLVLSALSALQGASQLGARPLNRLLCSLDNTWSEFEVSNALDRLLCSYTYCFLIRITEGCSCFSS